jgi:hypothetical protein
MRLLFALPILLLTMGCAGSGPAATDGGPTCEASKQSGLWLVPFGPVMQEINTKGTAGVSVVIVQGSAKEGEGHGVAGRTVDFRILNTEGDGSLDVSGPVTDSDGQASVTFKAGTQEATYQVQASMTGTCPKTFTIEVRQAARQLRAVTNSPFDTFTKVKAPVVVEALQVTTKGSAKLVDEEITFSLTTGKTGDTLIYDTDGNGGSATLKLKTNAAGRATAMVSTGSVPIPELKVVAAMTGTAEVEVKLRIVEGKAKPCTGPAECPLGYTCNNSICEAPQPPPPTGCTSNAECTPPTICDIPNKKCMQPTGQTCDPIEGKGCKTGDVCIGGQCATIPTTCVLTAPCPSTFHCVNGVCVPAGKPPTGGCVLNGDCPADQFCLNGTCTPKTACNIVHQPDRLQGTWKFDSMLHFREALNPILGGLLSAAGVLGDILEGNFKINGVPSWLTSAVSKYLKKLMQQYVPPWGQELIVTLGHVNDIVSDMRVQSTVQTSSVGGDTYVNNESWDLVEFTYKNQKISSPPSSIPEIGQVDIPGYTSREICGVLFIDKHDLKNVVGGLIKWAIDTALSLVTCNTTGSPCYNSVGDALEGVIDCASLGFQLDSLIQSLWSSAPSLAQSIESACNGQKGNLIKLIQNELNALTVKLNFLELSGTVNIPNPGSDTTLSNGKWFGVLGGGNFDGEFSAKKQ